MNASFWEGFMPVDIRLAKKGRSEPRDALAQQGRVSVELATQYATQLEAAGWQPAKTAELATGVTTLESAVAVQAESKVSARGSAQAETAAVAEAKKLKRRLDNVLPIVLRDANVPGLTRKSFSVGGTLGRSTPKISQYLARVRPHVVALDEALRPYFGGELASAQLDEVKRQLDEADTTQEVEITSLPLATQEVYEAKGRVLQLIEDLNRIAKNAFDGEAAIIGRFNKDLLVRARRAPKPPVTPAPE